MTHEVTDRHPAQALRRCATTPKKSLSAPGERGDVRSADAILHSNPSRWRASPTRMGTRAATLPMRFGDALLRQKSLSLHPENEGMSAAQTRYFIVTHIRRSAAMTHGDSGRHPAQALRRCATTPKELLSAPRERGDVRSADALSVNPGLRPGQSNQRSMHRNAVPLRHNLVFG